MQLHHEKLTIDNDLGTFEGFNHRTQQAIYPNVTAQELIDWDHDRHGEGEFWHSGDNLAIAQILTANHVVANEVIALDRLLTELGDDQITLAKLIYRIQHHGYALEQIEAEDIDDCPASYFIDDASFIDLRRTAAYELFELYYPEEFRVWDQSTCDGLIFDIDRFLDSPTFSTAEFQIGDDRILVVEPL
jgi:beta-galactosidase/beta-glucuronidase